MGDPNHGTGAASSSRPLRFRQKAALSAFAILVGVALSEALCRLCGLGDAGPAADYIANWELQWGEDFYTLDPRYPAPGDFINPDGLRDRQHELEKPDGMIRIACLGDSVTYGFLADHADSYPSRLETRLTDSGLQVEVFNVALPGWSIRQQRIAYERIVRKYDPDLIILGVCLNDVPEMQNNLLRPPPPWLTNLYRRSHLLRAIYRPRDREIKSVKELILQPDAPHVQRGWERYLQELEGLAGDLGRDRTKALLVALPFRFQLAPRYKRSPPQIRLKNHCAALNWGFIDPLPVLQATGSGAFLDHDHLSPEGAEVVASILTEHVKKTLSP